MGPVSGAIIVPEPAAIDVPGRRRFIFVCAGEVFDVANVRASVLFDLNIPPPAFVCFLTAVLAIPWRGEEGPAEEEQLLVESLLLADVDAFCFAECLVFSDGFLPNNPNIICSSIFLPVVVDDFLLLLVVVPFPLFPIFCLALLFLVEAAPFRVSKSNFRLLGDNNPSTVAVGAQENGAAIDDDKEAVAGERKP